MLPAWKVQRSSNVTSHSCSYSTGLADCCEKLKLYASRLVSTPSVVLIDDTLVVWRGVTGEPSQPPTVQRGSDTSEKCIVSTRTRSEATGRSTNTPESPGSFGRYSTTSWVAHAPGAAQLHRFSRPTLSWRPLLHGGPWVHEVPPPVWLPQGSVLVPLLYIIYTADLGSLLAAAAVLGQSYADDLQAYIHSMETLQSWMSSNRLRLNPTKTQLIWLCTPQQLSKIDL